MKEISLSIKLEVVTREQTLDFVTQSRWTLCKENIKVIIYPPGYYTKPRFAKRVYLEYRNYIDDKFNIIECSHDNSYIKIHSLSKLQETVCMAEFNSAELLYKSGSLGAIISIENYTRQAEKIDKKFYLLVAELGIF